MLADILASMADCEMPYKPLNPDAPDCIETMLLNLKEHCKIASILGGLSVYIFNEVDRWSVGNIALFKDVQDHLKKVQNPQFVVICTTAKKKDTVNPAFRLHWDEFVDRCTYVTVGVTADELNEYFAKVTDGAVENISFKIRSTSVRKAWEYCETNALPIIDTMPAPETFILPSGRKKSGSYRLIASRLESNRDSSAL